MKPSQAQTDQFQQSGFLVVEDFFDDSALGRWRTAFDEETHRRTAAKEWQPRRPLERRVDAGSRVFDHHPDLWMTSDSMRALETSSDLLEFAASLSSVRSWWMYQDQALTKKPFDGPTAFHLDVPYFAFFRRDAITVWVPLDDATIQNGCLYYVPGSHLDARSDNPTAIVNASLADIFKLYPNWRDRQPEPAVVRAGGVVFHNGLTCHGAGANMTKGSRRAMTYSLMPNGATFSGIQSVLSDELVSKLSVGDVLSDDTELPVVFEAVR